MAAPVILTVGGKLYQGWESVAIDRSITTMCAAWGLQTANPRPGLLINPLQPSLPAVLKSGTDALLTGVIDDIEGAAGGMTVKGRCATAELIDCSPPAPAVWKGVTVAALAAALCAPFGLDVVSEAPAGAVFETICAWPWERSFDVLLRAAKARGLLITTNADGALLITSGGLGGSTIGALIEGENCKLSWKASRQPRVAAWTAYGQTPPSAVTSGAAVCSMRGGSADLGGGAGRSRGEWISGPMGAAGAASAAGLLCTSAIADSYRITASVTGWRQGGENGPLWTFNQLVPVTSAALGLVAEMMLIEGVRLEYGKVGETAKLSLVRRDSYTAAAAATELG